MKNKNKAKLRGKICTTVDGIVEHYAKMARISPSVAEFEVCRELERIAEEMRGRRSKAISRFSMKKPMIRPMTLFGVFIFGGLAVLTVLAFGECVAALWK